MKQTIQTGGLKKFQYSKEDLNRIEKDPNDTTKEAKEALKKWYIKQDKKRAYKKLSLWKKISLSFKNNK
jgi:ribosomal protein L4